ncbi:hypothetical protein GCM10009820_24170 [Leifsonia soli]
MYAMVTKVRTPPRTSVPHVVPRALISKKRSKRPVEVGALVDAEMVDSRRIGGRWPGEDSGSSSSARMRSTKPIPTRDL